MSEHQYEKTYNHGSDKVEWSRIKQIPSVRKQIATRLIRYKDGELKIQIIHNKLDDLNEPTGGNLSRYSIKEIDVLIDMLQESKRELKKFINDSSFISDIINKLWLNKKGELK